MVDAITARWHAAIEELATTSDLGQGKLSIIRTSRAVDVDGTLVLIVGSAYARDILAVQAREQIATALATVTGQPVPFEVTVDASLEPTPVQPAAPVAPVAPVVPVATTVPVAQPAAVPTPSSDQPVPSVPAVPAVPTTAYPQPVVPGGPAGAPAPTSPPEVGGVDESRLNPRYTFDTYVQGESNRLARAAANAVAEAPARAYNPLFLYGDSGLGKTHLLHAIGHYARSLFPGIKVAYVSSEEFLSDFIASVSEGRMEAFKRRYRQVDILLIDDIQFLGGKDQTLEEFFHTFNALHNANKQVVLTSDVPPKELEGFEDRLLSRFESGLLADIKPPDLETRIAILSKKARADALDLPAEVLEYIATHVTSNIRELEGALIRVTALASLTKQPVDRTLAEMVLKDYVTDTPGGEVTVALIMAQTADYFGLTIEDLCSLDRTRKLVTPRHIAMYLCRELTDLSLPKIATEFGRKDHTTVMSADKKIRKQMAERRETYNQVAEITSRIKRAGQS